MDEVILSRIRQEAYEQGYQDGKVDGYNLAGTQMSSAKQERKKAEVVSTLTRCSECKFYMGDLDNQFLWNHDTDSVCEYWESDGLYPDDYCSQGVRKGEEDE